MGRLSSSLIVGTILAIIAAILTHADPLTFLVIWLAGSVNGYLARRYETQG